MAQDVLTSIDLSTGVPEGMSFSKDTNLFYKQYNLDYKVQGNGNHVIDADRLKLNVYFDIHKRADDLPRVRMAITTQTELVQAVYETGKPVPKEDLLRVCTESSKHGRMFICFVALILASYIRHIRDTKPELSKSFPSMSAILEEMQTIRCIEHDGRRKFITPFVGEQLLICDAFGFEVPEGCRPTYISKKSNKGKRGRPPKPETENS